MWQRVKALRVLLPEQIAWRKIFLSALAVAALVAAFFCGKGFTDPNSQSDDAPEVLDLNAKFVKHSKDPGAPVAYIYGNKKITRQELGEYLIDRLGAKRVEFLVNNRIIMQACRNRGIVISDAEVEARLIQMLKNMRLPSLDSFEKLIRQKSNKTIFEFKEDVIRPQLAMARLVRDDIKVSPKEIVDAFEAKYGAKVQCRMIAFPKDEKATHIADIWVKVRKDEKAFRKHARAQYLTPLASKGGKVPPIHKHFADKNIEKVAFSLADGEVSELIKLPDGSTVILKRDGFVPPSGRHTLADERRRLHQEVFERKLARKIPEVYKQFKKEANPAIMLKERASDSVSKRRINRELLRDRVTRARAEKAAKALQK